ncbi:uncharacterized protein LOC119989395 [Tripterygium wilfordii]|uniref:uncharacterized protein LOC119989395 n=1 Tax=Tripterygium wilfordii TaxID=458696 RepID=UPI0018F827BF|nr:uncharacterized protein LOC119989395 [Tripterygium wilfordii]
MARQTTFAATTLFTIILLLPTIYGQQDYSCDKEVEEIDISQQCKDFIIPSTILAMPLPRRDHQLRNLGECCPKLREFDEPICACDALDKVIKEAGGGEDAVVNAHNLLIYCRLPLGCDLISDRVVAS